MKGKALSHEVVQIFEEFTESVSIFQHRTYDTLNPVDKVRNAFCCLLLATVLIFCEARPTNVKNRPIDI